MKLFLTITSAVIAVAWIPLVFRFNRGWRERKNPVSLAIAATLLLEIYTNVLYVFALSGETSWRFFANATHVFGVIVIVNFYVAFRWSDKKFVDTRRAPYSVPPPNTTSTPRDS